MSALPTEFSPPRAERVRVTRDSLVVDLVDGRTIMAPLSWFPRLHHGTGPERGNWRLIAGGEGIHWPDLDEDIGVDGLLAGSPSGESQAPFQAWLNSRRLRRSDKRPHPPAAAGGPPKKRKRRVGLRG